MQTSSGICLCATRNHISCTRKRSGHNSVSVVLAPVYAVPICRTWRGVSRARLFILIRGADNTELDEKVYRLDMVNSRKLIFRIFSMWNLFVNCIFSAQRQIHFSCIFIACASASVENIAGYLARREHTNHSSSYFFHILYHSCSLQSSLF